MVHGSAFHKIAEQFVQWLTRTEAKKASKMNDPDVLWDAMYEVAAEEKIDELTNALLSKGKSLESVLHMTACLQSFCRRLVELRHRTKGFRSWQDVFMVKEFSLPDVQFKFERTSIFISGQVDAVRTHPKYGIEIVDYKLSRGTNMKHDLLQLAIYAKLLTMKKPGLKFHGSIEYYLPDLQEVPCTPRDLQDLFTDMVWPVLHELAGVPAPTDRTRPSNGKISPEPTGTGAGGKIEPKPPEPPPPGLSEKIEKCFAAFKLNVEVLDQTEAPQLVRYTVKPAPGVKVVSLANRAEDLQVALGLDQPPLIEPGSDGVAIYIPKPKPDTILWEDVIKDPAYRNRKSPVVFPIGVSVTNDLLTADLADSNMCHVLVAGASGSGKSEFLKSLVAALMFNNSPSTLRLTLIDPKILTFGNLKGSPFLKEPVLTDIHSVIPCLERAVEEMDRRYKRLAEEKFENLMARYQKGLKDIPFYVIVFDEFADLILSGKDQKNAFESLVARIAAKGRAAGIHLVLATQRPDAKVVTGLIKSNLPLKVCLRVTTGTNSQIILDQGGGQALLGRGDLLCDRGKGIDRAQSPYITQEKLHEIAQI